MKGNIIGSLFLLILAAGIGWMVWTGMKMMKPVVHELAAELRGQVECPGG